MQDYDNFILPADDLQKGKEFYQDTLGLAVKFDFPDIGMTAFQVGEQEPGIILSSNPATKPAIWFVVDDARQKFAELKSKGVRFCSEPFLIKTGWAAEFEDPFGNRLAITDYTVIPG
jgi:predicted enzyme related to lactoylglutathione lyase